MSNLASFSFGTIVIGILVAVIAAILLLLLPFFFHKNRRFSALSYLCAMLFAVCLCICNIYFCGLVKGKSILSDYEHLHNIVSCSRVVIWCARIVPICTILPLLSTALMSPKNLLKSNIGKSIPVCGFGVVRLQCCSYWDYLLSRQQWCAAARLLTGLCGGFLRMIIFDKLNLNIIWQIIFLSD